MTEADLITRYNYDEFVPHKFEQWLNFAASPPLGQPHRISRCGSWTAQQRG